MTTHNGTFCIKSVKQLQVDTHITPTSNFNLGEALGHIYPLLDIIFRYLPLNDLNSCLKVSSAWKEKAEQVLARRVAPSWFTCFKVGAKGCKGNNLIHSPNLNYNNVDIGIILYDSCRIKLNKYICLHSNVSELSRMSVPEYLEEELVPKSVDYCMLSVHRVVSNFYTKRPIKEIQYHGSIFDGVFIPKIPSIRTVLFHCNPSKKKEVENTVNMHIKPNEMAKCLLVFCKTHLEESLYNLLKYLVPKGQPSSVALGGGVIRGTKTFQRISKDRNIFTVKDTVCILFLKDGCSDENNFEAYSCVIKGNELSKEEFDSKLLHFKQNVKLKHHSLGFRVCCSAKYQETELDSFHEIFPSVPLLSVDAYGEIGWNCYPNASNLDSDELPQKAKRMRKNKHYPNAENYFSTIFVLATWDK